MIARTIEVTAEFTSNIIEATATIADHVVEADATLTTSVRHWQTEYPDYEGAYEITPSAEAQTLPSTDTVMHGDIVINPIPSNYGLITWNGATLTVS